MVQVSDYLGAFLFSFGVRMCILMAVGMVLQTVIFQDMSLIFFAIVAAAPSAYFAHKNAIE